MATAAILGGGMIVGGLLAGKGAKEQAEAQASAARANLRNAQDWQAQQQANAQPFINNATLAQNTQLGLLGIGGSESAASKVLDSPLVKAINEMNLQNITAQGAASGVSGGNLLTALQDANTSTILQAAMGNLGNIAGQGLQGGLGFTGQAATGLGYGMQAQTDLGNAQGAANAVPYLTGAGIMNNLTNLGAFGMSGGFNNMSAPNFSLPSFGGGTPPAATSNVVQNPVMSGTGNYLF